MATNNSSDGSSTVSTAILPETTPQELREIAARLGSPAPRVVTNQTTAVEPVTPVTEPFVRPIRRQAIQATDHDERLFERTSLDLVEETPGRYTNLGEYARGGIGRILIVHDEHLRRDIALKELLPRAVLNGSSMGLDGDESPDVSFAASARFLQEAKITGQLEHPSIVPVHELGMRDDGTIYYTMKFVRGQTLSALLERAKTPEDRLRLLPHFANLCQAIAYAHSRGVIHRDIKPSNVMVGEFGETVVLDWGLARAKGWDGSFVGRDDDMFTTSPFVDGGEVLETEFGRVIGTPTFMSPEQARCDHDAVDERSDIYALGAVLYVFLTGKYPYSGATKMEVLNKVQNEDPTSVLAIEPRLPKELAAICERAMRRDPEQRYGSAKDLAEEISRFQTGALVQAYEYGFQDHLTRFAWRYKNYLMAAAVCVVTLVGLVSLAYGNVLEEREIALQARDNEYAQRVVATQAREAEHVERLAAERLLYESSVRLADARIEEGRYDLALGALSSAPESLRNWEWSYLDRVCTQDMYTIADLAPGESSIAVSPDGKRLAIASSDGTVRVVDSATGREFFREKIDKGAAIDVSFSPDGSRVGAISRAHIHIYDLNVNRLMVEIRGDFAPTARVVFSPDGGSVAAALVDNSVRLWNAFDGVPLATLVGHSENVVDLTFDLDSKRLWTFSQDRTLQEWSVSSGESLAILNIDLKDIKCLQRSRDGTLTVVVSNDGKCEIWDMQALRLRASLPSDEAPILSIGISSDGKRIVAGLDNGEIRMFSSDTGKPLLLMEGHTGPVLSVSFDESGEWLVSAGADKSVRLWDVTTGKLIRRYQGHSNRVLQATFVPSLGSIVSSSMDATVRTWSTSDAAPAPSVVLKGHRGNVTKVAFSPNGDKAFSLSDDNNDHIPSDFGVRVWDTATNTELLELHKDNTFFYDAAWSPDGSLIAVGCGDGSASLFDAVTGEEQFVLAGHSSIVTSVAFSQNGEMVLTTSMDGTAKLWQTRSGACSAELAGHEGHVFGGAFSPDGTRVATFSRDKTVKLWDTSSGQVIATLPGHERRPGSVQFSHDGNYLATTDGMGAVRLWDGMSGAAIAECVGHRNIVWGASFSPDDAQLCTVSADGIMKTWDVSTGRELASSSGHTGSVWSCIYSPDGSRILTAGEDATIRLWDSMTGREMCVMEGHEGSVQSAGFSPDGRTIISGSDDETVRLWRGV